jgi:predicted dehydrogenase
MTRRHRVAIVGAGIGAAHNEAFQAHPEQFEVALICDVDPERASRLAAAAPGAAICAALDEVLARADLDIVDICLPPFLHYDAVKRGLAAGKHVICEKPLVGSLAEVDQLAGLADACGRRLMPVMQYRFGNGFRRLRHLVERGVAGRAYLATVETHWTRDAVYYASPWRGRKTTELGGALLSQAIHAHDLLLCLLGPARRVFARTATRVNPIETEDCAVASLEMTDGSLAGLSVTLGSAGEISRLRFCFEGLTAESSHAPYRASSEPWRLVPRSAEHAGRIETALADFAPREEGLARQFALLHEALETGGPLPVTLKDARRSIELAAALYHSAATGSDVELPLAPDHPAYRGWR